MKPELSEFATAKYPLRPSQLPHLILCPWRSVLMHLKEFEDQVGAAANTGSAVHKAAETLHRYNKNYDDCMTEAKAHTELYPLADWDEVRLHFQPYYNDPRNHDVNFLGIEQQFTLEFENTQNPKEPIVMWGTLDQCRIVRENMFEEARTILYDIKTGKSMDVWETLMWHMMQLAAYVVGGESKGFGIDAVGIIYTNGYRKRGAALPSPQGVFVDVPMTVETAKILLKGAFNRVNNIRRGEIEIIPGHHCNKCPAKSISMCVPLYHEFDNQRIKLS